MGNILFSETNVVPGASMTSSPAPVTPLEWLANSYSARRTKWTDLSTPEITANFIYDDEPAAIDYVAILNSNLSRNARIRILVFDTPSSLVHNSGWVPVTEHTTIESLEDAVIFIRLPQLVLAQRLAVQVQHGYDYIAPEETTEETPPEVITETVSDGIYLQGERILSLEMENADFTDSGSDNFIIRSGGSSSGDGYIEKADNTFYHNANDGPKASFLFTASRSGSHDLWARIKTANSKNSMYSHFDGSSKAHFLPTNYSAWTWHKLNSYTMAAGSQHTVAISARDNQIEIDKIIMQPAGDAAPSGLGADESGEGVTITTTVINGTQTTTFTAGSTETVELRGIMAGVLTTLDRNFAQGADSGFIEPPDIRRTASGRKVHASDAKPMRSLSLSLPQMSESDWRTITRLKRENSDKPLIVSAYPDAEPWQRDAHTFLALFEGQDSYKHRVHEIHSTSITLGEA